MKRFTCAVLAVSICALAGAEALGQEAITGRITTLNKRSGSVVIQHPDGATTAGDNGAILRNHDRVIISGDAYACIQTYEDRNRCHSAADRDGEIRIEGRVQERHRPGPADFFSAWLDRSDRSLSSSARTRGGDDAGDVFQASALLTPDRVSRLQYVTRDLDILLPIWVGPSAALSVSDGDAVVASSARLELGQPVNLPKPLTAKGSLSLKAQNAELQWDLEPADRPPQPPGMNLPDGEMTVLDRTDRAAWLLKSGPVAWRLFALSDLYRMAQKGSFEAQLLLEFAKSDACAHKVAQSDQCPF